MSLLVLLDLAALVVEPVKGAPKGSVYIHTPIRPGLSPGPGHRAHASTFNTSSDLPLLGYYLCFNSTGDAILRVCAVASEVYSILVLISVFIVRVYYTYYLLIFERSE